MALPLGKLTILLGAGLAGSVLAKEGRLSNVSDFVSGAFKIVWKQIKSDDKSAPSVSKPRNDTLLAQVDSLRQELQYLASNRSVTIIASGGAGATKYGVIIIIVAAGSGYVWWKGWKLPDMMFATKRSLSDACNAVGKRFEGLYASISAAQQQLSSEIINVDRNVKEIADTSEATKLQVAELSSKSKTIGEDCQSFHDLFQSLERKVSQIEAKQDITTLGVKKLCDVAGELENGRSTERIQASPYSFSLAARELPSITSSSRTGSLPPLPLEPQSPSYSNGSHKVDRTLQSAISASGLKDFDKVSEESLSTPTGSNGFRGLESGSWRFGGAVLTRQRSVTNPVAQAQSGRQ